MKVTSLIAAAGATGALLAGIAVFAQNGSPAPKPSAPTQGKAHLWSQVGSFQLEGHGTVKVKFVGTLLVVRAPGQPMPQVTIQGKVRKEFENVEMGRTAWFGTGNATITGNWRHLSVFGEQIDATWNGAGMATVFGEFDSAGKTGFITVDGSKPFEWLATGQAFYVPATSDPRIQRNGTAPSKVAPVPKSGG